MGIAYARERGIPVVAADEYQRLPVGGISYPAALSPRYDNLLIVREPATILSAQPRGDWNQVSHVGIAAGLKAGELSLEQ